jgi:hypothetical protein
MLNSIILWRDNAEKLFDFLNSILSWICAVESIPQFILELLILYHVHATLGDVDQVSRAKVGS